MASGVKKSRRPPFRFSFYFCLSFCTAVVLPSHNPVLSHISSERASLTPSQNQQSVNRYSSDCQARRRERQLSLDLIPAKINTNDDALFETAPSPRRDFLVDLGLTARRSTDGSERTVGDPMQVLQQRQTAMPNRHRGAQQCGVLVGPLRSAMYHCCRRVSVPGEKKQHPSSELTFAIRLCKSPSIQDCIYGEQLPQDIIHWSQHPYTPPVV